MQREKRETYTHAHVHMYSTAHTPMYFDARDGVKNMKHVIGKSLGRRRIEAWVDRKALLKDDVTQLCKQWGYESLHLGKTDLQRRRC